MLGIVGLIAAAGLLKGELSAAFLIRAIDGSGLLCIAIGCIALMGSFDSRGGFEARFSRNAGGLQLLLSRPIHRSLQ